MKTVEEIKEKITLYKDYILKHCLETENSAINDEIIYKYKRYIFLLKWVLEDSEDDTTINK